MGNVSYQLVDKTKTHFLFNILFTENRPVYQIILKYSVDFLIVSSLILLKMGTVSDQLVDKNKTHFLFNILFTENRPVCQIILKYSVEPYRPQMTISRTRLACWIPKSTAHAQNI